MKEDHKKLVLTGAEMGARMLMIKLLGAAEKESSKGLDYIQMQYLFQETLEAIKTMPIPTPQASHN